VPGLELAVETAEVNPGLREKAIVGGGRKLPSATSPTTKFKGHLKGKNAARNTQGRGGREENLLSLSKNRRHEGV